MRCGAVRWTRVGRVLARTLRMVPSGRMVPAMTLSGVFELNPLGKSPLRVGVSSFAMARCVYQRVRFGVGGGGGRAEEVGNPALPNVRTS